MTEIFKTRKTVEQVEEGNELLKSIASTVWDYLIKMAHDKLQEV